MNRCSCDISILKALEALTDWAIGSLRNFHRELKHELKPYDKTTNAHHLKELRRIEKEWKLGTAAIKNTMCKHPLVFNCLLEFENVYEWVGGESRKPWSKELRSVVFLNELVDLVRRLLGRVNECMIKVQQAITALMQDRVQ
jgi:hypothetical protein